MVLIEPNLTSKKVMGEHIGIMTVYCEVFLENPRKAVYSVSHIMNRH